MNNNTIEKNNDDRITVEIYNVKYPLKGVSDHAKLKKIAAMIDSHMHNLAKTTPFLTPDRIAVLTALHLAEQLVTLKDDYDALWEMLQEHHEEE